MPARLRWKLGVLQDKQVDCKTDTSTSTHLIKPAAWSGEYQKAAVIPVAETEVIVIESLRRQGKSGFEPRARNFQFSSWPVPCKRANFLDNCFCSRGKCRVIVG
jgi:hypothetical protein